MRTLPTVLIATGLLLGSAIGLPLRAQTVVAAASTAASTAPTTPAATSTDEPSDGEVRKIDKEQGKITLKHGPIKNLDMPGMTMVFAVKDKAMLDKVKPGDKVKFKAVSEGGKYTVMELKPAP